MKFRRIEALRPYVYMDGEWVLVDHPQKDDVVVWDWVGVAALKRARQAMYLLGLPELKLPRSVYSDPRLRFWWTERGWEEIGHKVLLLSRGPGIRLRVLESENPGRIIGQDRWQVAALPDKTKERRTKNDPCFPRDPGGV